MDKSNHIQTKKSEYIYIFAMSKFILLAGKNGRFPTERRLTNLHQPSPKVFCFVISLRLGINHSLPTPHLLGFLFFGSSVPKPALRCLEYLNAAIQKKVFQIGCLILISQRSGKFLNSAVQQSTCQRERDPCE